MSVSNRKFPLANCLPLVTPSAWPWLTADCFLSFAFSLPCSSSLWSSFPFQPSLPPLFFSPSLCLFMSYIWSAPSLTLIICFSFSFCCLFYYACAHTDVKIDIEIHTRTHTKVHPVTHTSHHSHTYTHTKTHTHLTALFSDKMYVLAYKLYFWTQGLMSKWL